MQPGVGPPKPASISQPTPHTRALAEGPSNGHRRSQRSAKRHKPEQLAAPLAAPEVLEVSSSSEYAESSHASGQALEQDDPGAKSTYREADGSGSSEGGSSSEEASSAEQPPEEPPPAADELLSMEESSADEASEEDSSSESDALPPTAVLPSTGPADVVGTSAQNPGHPASESESESEAASSGAEPVAAAATPQAAAEQAKRPSRSTRRKAMKRKLRREGVLPYPRKYAPGSWGGSVQADRQSGVGSPANLVD